MYSGIMSQRKTLATEEATLEMVDNQFLGKQSCAMDWFGTALIYGEFECTDFLS